MGRSVILKIAVLSIVVVGVCACGPQFEGAGVDGAAEQSKSLPGQTSTSLVGAIGEPVLYKVDYSDDVMWERYLSEKGSYKIPEGVIGAVLPHHLITALELTRFYRGLSEVITPRVIVIMSPNHYEAGEANIQTCNCSYKTFDGVDLRTSGEELGRLLGAGSAAGSVAMENADFEIEHGIYAHANFIKRFFPEAEILPVMIKKETPREELDRLVEYFEGEFGEGDGGEGLGKSVLFVASVDFAHYMTKEVSDGHDEVSFDAISQFDYDAYRNLELDSPGSIYVLSRLSEGGGARQVDLIEHTNSQDYFYNRYLEETTSHLYITFSKGM